MAMRKTTFAAFAKIVRQNKMTTTNDVEKLTKSCPRCSHFFYSPDDLIQSEKQRAAEWEETAMDTATELAEALAENAKLKEELLKGLEEGGVMSAEWKCKSCGCQSVFDGRCVNPYCAKGGVSASNIQTADIIGISSSELARLKELEAITIAQAQKIAGLEAERESWGNEYNAVLIMKLKLDKAREALEKISGGPGFPLSMGLVTPLDMAVAAARWSQKVAREALKECK